MINNEHISLSQSSTVRTDALNSIKHTLLLDYQTPQIADLSNPIPEIIKNCHWCCSGLFKDVEYCSLSNNNFGFYFFGSPSNIGNNIQNSSKKKRKENSKLLSSLDEYKLPTDNKTCTNSENQNIKLPDMILDHCVLSCYHAVITDLLYDQTVTLYECVNDIKYAGVHSLYKNGKIDFKNKNEKLLKRDLNKQSGNTKKSSLASDFGRKVTSHFKSLPYFETLFTSQIIDNSSPKNVRYYLQFSGLLSHICEIDARSLKLFSKTITEYNRGNILQHFESISDSMSNRPSKDNTKSESVLLNHDSVDDLYYRYIIERTFNFNLFYSLLRNIHRIESNTNFQLCQEEILKILCLCQKLPNAFSRQCFLQYAFDNLITQPDSYFDFWHDHQLNMNNYVLEYYTKPRLGFQFMKWINQFEHFCNYIGDFVIPIYEWCFTNMLMEVIENTLSKKENCNDSTVFHKLCLFEAFQILSNYMEKKENYNRILQPIPISNSQGSLDIATVHAKGVLDLNIPAHSLQYLFRAFDPALGEQELNLVHLDRNFFIYGTNDKDTDKNHTSPKQNHIRNFYINLLYPD